MLGPEALEEAAWWAAQAGQAGREAQAAQGQSMKEPRALSRAAAYAQIAQAYAAVAQAAADSQAIRRWGTEEWQAWDNVVGGRMPGGEATP